MCTDHYRHWSTESTPEKRQQQRLCVETMLASKFVLCPPGASDASIRLFEAMELGCVPVVIADRWIPVDGVDWRFFLFVKEARLFEIDAIVRSHEHEWQERGAAARSAFEAHFAPATFGHTTARQSRHLVRHRNAARERLIQAIYPLYRGSLEAKWRLRMRLRSTVLAGLAEVRAKPPGRHDSLCQVVRVAGVVPRVPAQRASTMSLAAQPHRLNHSPNTSSGRGASS